MGIFSRLFSIGKAEANSAIDKLEDPIKMTEQGIRELKEDLDKSLQAYAEVKALAIRTRREAAEAREKSSEYEKKAILLVQRSQTGQISVADADRLASESLVKKEEAMKNALRFDGEAQKIETSMNNLDTQIRKLRSNITQYENELQTLKARSKVSEATKNVNKQLVEIDGSGTVSMLERMKEKVEKQEALAEAYGSIANENKSLDDEIESALDKSSTTGSDALAALKAKLGQNTQLPPAL